jgi:hypothetical protein
MGDRDVRACGDGLFDRSPCSAFTLTTMPCEISSWLHPLYLHAEVVASGGDVTRHLGRMISAFGGDSPSW